MTTETSNDDPRARAARSNLALAFVAQGTAPGIARHVADTATVTVAGNGALIEVGSLRAIDTPEGCAELAKRLTQGTTLKAADAPADDPTAGNAEARAAGQAAAAAARVASQASALAFK